jgi:hypothetical protein
MGGQPMVVPFEWLVSFFFNHNSAFSPQMLCPTDVPTFVVVVVVVVVFFRRIWEWDLRPRFFPLLLLGFTGCAVHLANSHCSQIYSFGGYIFSRDWFCFFAIVHKNNLNGSIAINQI